MPLRQRKVSSIRTWDNVGIAIGTVFAIIDAYLLYLR